MKYNKLSWEDIFVQATLSEFKPEDGVKEIHAMLEFTNPELPASAQFDQMDRAIERLMLSKSQDNCTLVLKRYFVSDAANQASFLSTTANEAISVVQQPPLNGTKVSVWLYFVEDAFLTHDKGDNITLLKRPAYTHLYHTQVHEKIGDINRQTDAVFGQYTQSLAGYDCSLEANCIRTWIFVQDVDVQYMGMVNFRKYYFAEAGLTPDTHFIASTGIEGRYIYPEVLMLMDAYAIDGIRKEQIQFLQAPTHLNPTYEYGVTFERGTVVKYGDREHIYISGTASINNKGEIVHPLNIIPQTERTLENIEALLNEAGAKMSNIAQMIVYLRDTADYLVVSKYLEKQYPDTPKVMVLAPVCRPGWLIEIECIAIKEFQNISFEKF